MHYCTNPPTRTRFQTPSFHQTQSLTMGVATLTKGSTVEVSSDDVGFEGAWYVATLMDVIEPSPTRRKTSNKKSTGGKKAGYVVKYDTLFEEGDPEEQLTEVVDPSFVRPVPPRNPRRDNVNEAGEFAESEEVVGDFELHDVVDAYHRDGWWIGVVNNVIIEGQIKKYNVSFDSPPEEVVFERSQLRLHVDWIDCCWKVPPKKIPSIGALTTDSDNLNLNRPISVKRKHHSQSCKKTEINGKTDGNVEISCGKRFQSFTGSNGNDEVMVSAMEAGGSPVIMETPVTEHGKSQSRRKRGRPKKFQIKGPNGLVEGSNGNAEVMVSAIEGGGSPVIMETPVTEHGKSQSRRKRGRPKKFQIKTPNGLVEDNQEAGNGIHEISTKLDKQPISVWYERLHPLSVLKRASCCSAPDHRDDPSDALNRAILQQDLPFIKQSPIWATIESLELYQKPPQKPHFSPLKHVKENYREGLAIAQMVTFANVVQMISKLQWSDANDVFENSLEALLDLETYGFDVCAARARLHKLLSTKTLVSRLEEELEESEKQIEKHTHEKTVIDKEINELELKMQNLQEKLTQNVTLKNVKDAEITMLHTNLEAVSKRMKDQKLAFKILAASPL